MQPIEDIRVRLDGEMHMLETLVSAPSAPAGDGESEGPKALAKRFEDLKVRYLGKKGDISGLLRSMGTLAPEARPEFGKLVNELRDYAEARFGALQARIQEAEIAGSLAGSSLDASLPGYRMPLGSLHPMTQ